MLLSGIRSTRLQRRSVFWLVSLLALVSARGQPAEVAGTLPEDYLPPLKAILQNAWTQSPQTIEKSLEFAQSEARADIHNSARFPQLRAGGQFASNETAVSGNNASRNRDNGFFYSVDLSQAIFRWGELKNRSALGEIGVLIAGKNYAEAYRLLVQVLRQSYLDLIYRKMAIAAVRERYRLAEDDLKLAESNFERGALSPGELAGRRLALDEQAVQLAIQEEDFASALRTFVRLAGAKDLTAEAIPTGIPRPAYSVGLTKTIVADALRDGGKFSFEAEINALRAREADLNYRIARTQLLPKVDAAAIQSLQSVTTADPNTVQQTGVAYQTLALRVNWAIFDGLATRGAKREALAARELYRRRSEQASEVALERVQQLSRRLELDARLMEFGDAHANIAAAGEQQQRAELELGNVSPLAVANARISRLEREAGSALQRATFLVRWSEFVSLAGLDPAMNHLPARYVREQP